ncbi:ATP phosphoribosyltransferase regulatory subunit [Roseospirillum parvum]|uniref:ATP phosphoribosyltransferase regulatory subunit n=1 Tax=Roseospirillum parvum TaxID=83401 RepID=A0A1G7XLU9_9PROT|nr:ATP phosphoribosyltransferase regulatory subunit [Roseospirillum parvum]SDG85219.1 ATP phosphoribosyltransferase regulatory subunit [Roseospirillum parvum]
MTTLADKALLPTGLEDLVPPRAEIEGRAVEAAVGFVAANGYRRIKPPLIEFEETLLGGPGAATGPATFRVMDPLSQRMMGLRADMTIQAARIAATRLNGEPRPLRLAYAGQVLRVKGTQLRPRRQFTQAGIELIGTDTPAADAEVIMLAAGALEHLGIGGVSVDLSLPTLVPAVCRGLGLDDATTESLILALDHKDAGTVAALAGPHGALLGGLMEALGPAERAVAALAGLDLPAEAATLRDRLLAVLDCLNAQDPTLRLTVDPTESRGFEYHSGVAFTVFADGGRGELARGGRYRATLEPPAPLGIPATSGEPATGMTLSMDAITELLPEPPARPRVLVPAATDPALRRRLHGQGFVTLGALDGAADLKAEARRLGCDHVLEGDHPVAL